MRRSPCCTWWAGSQWRSARSPNTNEVGAGGQTLIRKVLIKKVLFQWLTKVSSPWLTTTTCFPSISLLRMTGWLSISVRPTSSSTTRCRTQLWATNTTPGPSPWGPASPSQNRWKAAHRPHFDWFEQLLQEEISAMITDIVEKLHWNPVEIARQLKVCDD